MFPHTWISIPVKGDLIMLPNGTLLHFQMFSLRVIEILAAVRREDSGGNLQFAGTKGKGKNLLLPTSLRQGYLST